MSKSSENSNDGDNLHKPWIQPISSSENENFKRWTHLLNSKGIKKFQQILVSGSKIINEQIANADRGWEWIGTGKHTPPKA